MQSRSQPTIQPRKRALPRGLPTICFSGSELAAEVRLAPRAANVEEVVDRCTRQSSLNGLHRDEQAEVLRQLRVAWGLGDDRVGEDWAKVRMLQQRNASLQAQVASLEQQLKEERERGLRGGRLAPIRALVPADTGTADTYTLDQIKAFDASGCMMMIRRIPVDPSVDIFSIPDDKFSPQVLYANPAMCAKLGDRTQEEYIRRHDEHHAKITPGFKNVLRNIFNKVQFNHQSIKGFVTTWWPKGINGDGLPFKAAINLTPIGIKMPDGQVVRAQLMQEVPLPVKPPPSKLKPSEEGSKSENGQGESGALDTKSDASSRSSVGFERMREAWFNTVEPISMFRAKTGEVLFQNIASVTWLKKTESSRDAEHSTLRSLFLNEKDFNKMLVECLTEAKVFSQVLEMPKLDGQKQWHLLNCMRTQDPGEGGDVIVVVQTDQTELKLTTDELKLAEERKLRQVAEAKLHAEQEVIAYLCHEIRNPLNAMQKVLELVGQELRNVWAADMSAGSTQWKMLCDGALKRSQYVSSLMDGMLDLSKLDDGTLALQSQRINMHSIVDEVFEMLAPLKKSEAVQLVNAVESDLEILGDTTRWTQLLANFVSNSIKHTEAGHVKIAMIPKKSAVNSSYDLTVQIIDTGCGIHPSIASSLFTKYSALQQHKSDKSTGLGLAISQSIARLMGAGDIEVTSPCSSVGTTEQPPNSNGEAANRPGPGSMFSFTCPGIRLQRKTAQAEASAVIVLGSHENAQNQHGHAVPTTAGKLVTEFQRVCVDSNLSVRRVLVLEDDQINSTLLKHALERAPQLQSLKLHVDCVSTAEVMVELYKSGKWAYELVIVDEILADAGGVMLGTEACVVLRNSGCTSKFIFSSANSSAEDVAKYEAAGGCATWPKPYPPIEDMANDIRATLQIHESLSRKVLLVEDDAMNIMILKHALLQSPGLKALGLEVHTASTVEQMLQLHSDGEWGFDVVIIDEHLDSAGGLLSGSEGVAELRKRGISSLQTKCVCCSGDCGPKDQAQYRKAGADVCWPKPYPMASEMEHTFTTLLNIRPDSSARRVLLVEDDTISTMILKHTLETDSLIAPLGLAVDTIDTAEKMLDLYSSNDRAWAYSILIVDEKLAGEMRGSEAVAELRKRGCTSRIVMCSGNCSASERERYVTAGSDMVWPKPFPDASALDFSLRSLLHSDIAHDPAAARVLEESLKLFIKPRNFCDDTKQKVLLIEDDQLNAVILRQTLESAEELQSMRLEVEVMNTAEEMLDLHAKAGETWDYAFLVIDENLRDAGGVMLGSEAVAELRKRGCTTSIVMCSGNCTANDMSHYINAGSDACWPKPFPSAAKMESSLRELQRRANEEESRRSRRRRRDVKVLLVETDEIHAIMLKHTLENGGLLIEALNLCVDTCTTAERMLELYDAPGSWGYSLLIVDAQLAGGEMSGIDGIAELRRRGCRSTKAICCSIFFSAEDEQRYTDAGADAVWPKPLPQVADMVASLGAVLGGADAGAAEAAGPPSAAAAATAPAQQQAAS